VRTPKGVMNLTIGIPVRNEEGNIPALREEIEKIVKEIEKRNIEVEVIVNENMSSDSSLKLLTEWQRDFPNMRLFALETPLTFQASILSMMSNAKGDAFVVYQSDLQDPPEVILTFVDLWLQGNEIVAGVITSRQEGMINRAGRSLFYHSLKSVADANFVIGLQDFYLVSKRIYKSLESLPREGLFLRGHISSRFGSVVHVPYSRRKRSVGTTNFNYPQKYSLALDALLLFGTRFIRVLSTISFILFGIATILIVCLSVSYVFGFRFQIRGWASLSLLILSLFSVLGLATGLILEYLIRIYRLLVFGHEK
jgi:glycosyltransferase involved in cell wall biosynthesis